MKTTLMIIGIISVLSSCNCLKIKNDVRRVWSFHFKECRCQWYSFNSIKELTKLVPCEDFFEAWRAEDSSLQERCNNDSDFNSKNPELCQILPNESYCDDLVGFSKESWGKNITPKGRESIRCYKDNCQKDN
jgi:hypothetical protein